jgi:hypothetical protein
VTKKNTAIILKAYLQETHDKLYQP